MRMQTEPTGRVRPRPAWAWSATAVLLPAFAATAVVAAPTPAAADFRVCNTTLSRVGVAIGYRGADGWTTEGWWNIYPNSCETVLRGPLVARYYYLYAMDYDHGGEWGGEAFMCTRDQMFTIQGIEGCEERGFVRTGFFEVDTRERQSWTVQLTDPAAQGNGER